MDNSKISKEEKILKYETFVNEKLRGDLKFVNNSIYILAFYRNTLFS